MKMNITRKEFYAGAVVVVGVLLGSAHTVYVTDTLLIKSIAGLYRDMVKIDTRLEEVENKVRGETRQELDPQDEKAQ